MFAYTWSWRDEEGRFLTLERVTPARAYAEGMAWDAKGRPYGEPKYGAWPSIREVKDGDEALDAAWHAQRKAEKAQQAHHDNAFILANVPWRVWERLSPERMAQVKAWIEEVRGG